jgi:PTS system nitrogen regulatory IIA component
MKISDFLSEKAVCADLKATTKEGIIREIVELLVECGNNLDVDKVVKILLEREALGSTGIGQGIGIPHGKCEDVKHLIGALGICRKGVNFDALDGEPVYILFLLLAPEDSAGPHLKALARISRLLKDKFLREMLRSARDEKTVYKVISQEDQRKT